jgi:hypothetical protein
LLAVLGLLAAGCASGKKAGWVTGATNRSLTHSITVLGRTATIPDVQTGTRISCRGWPGGA